MVDVTIDGLLDGENIRKRGSVGAFNQDGITYKGSVPPNPARQINVTSQAQLEEELGSDLEIPDGDSLTIIIEESFTLTKPFKIGLGSTLQISSPIPNTILTYSGLGALFQNTNPDNLIDSIILKDIGFTGSGANPLFDIVGTNIVNTNNATFAFFDSLGTLDIPFELFTTCLFSQLNKGLTMINPLGVGIFRCSMLNFTPTNMTLFSIIAGTNPAGVAIDAVRTLSLFVGDTLLFFDPSSPASSVFAVDRSNSGFADFYQQGTDIATISVADNGSGKTRFTTAAPHGLVVGKPVILSGNSDSDYNGTFIVTAVDTPLTGTTFDVDITFALTDAGSITTQSLDSTDVPVIATANQGIPNSMFTGDAGLEIFGSEISSSSLAQDTFEAITSASWGFNNLERFDIGVNNEGQLVTLDTENRRYGVVYSATIEKSGGGAVDIGIILLKNGIPISFNAPHTVNPGPIQIGTGDIVQLTAGDTIQVAVINYESTAAVIDISQVSLVVNRA